MKKFILLLLLLSSMLFADCSAIDSPIVLKTFGTDKNITIDNISKYASKFKLEKQELRDAEFEIILFNSEDESTIKQSTIHPNNWIMLELDSNLSSGNYWIEHTDFEFVQHSFSLRQSVDKFSLFGRRFFSFHYDKNQDNRRYFLKALNTQSHVVPLATLYTPQSFSKWADAYSLKMLLSFFLFGLIFMASLYNGALYLYNREKSFLYYMLMQFFMVGVLVYQTDIIQILTMGNIENEEIAIFFYFVIVEVAIIFILHFIRAFLETKKELPFHDKILGYIMIFAIVDLVLFFFPIMLVFRLYSFLLLYIIWVAWLRLKQGYRPALFFIFGWSALMIGVFISDFYEEEFYIDPILIGSTIEALFLSVAISYKMREIKDEKVQRFKQKQSLFWKKQEN